MKKGLVLGLVLGIMGTGSPWVITNGGDRGVLLAEYPDDPMKAADSPGDVIGVYYEEAATRSCTSNVVTTYVFEGTETIIRILPNEVYTKKNGTFTVKIQVENVAGLDAIDMYLLFDPAKIALIGSPTQGSIFSGNIFFELDASNIDKGVLRISGARFGSSFTGTGTIGENAIFKTLVDDPTSKIELGTTSLVGVEVGEIPHFTSPCDVIPYLLTSFVLIYPIDVIAGRPWTITVTAKDQNQNTLQNYQGSITITSNPGTITHSIGSFTQGTAIATITRHQVGSISITVLDPIVGVSSSTMPITVRYLCDFGKGINNTTPDNKMDIWDLVLFISYWRSKNPKGDVGDKDQTGNPPYIISKPDGKIDIWDLLIFIKMWRWSNQKKVSSSDLSLPNIFFSPSYIEAKKGDRLPIDLKISGGSSLFGYGLKIRYNPERLKVVSVKEGEYFKGGFPFEEEREDGAIILNDAGAGEDIELGVSGDGTIAKIEFEALVDDPESTIEIIQDTSLLLSIDGEKKYTTQAAKVEALGPAYSALFQSVPNPAKTGVWIPYQLKEGANVQIKIYNILGQVVRDIEPGYKKRNYYTSLKQGGAEYWNLTNNRGERVANGLYFYSLKAGDFSDIKKMLIKK